MRPEHIAQYVDKADVYAYGEASDSFVFGARGSMEEWRIVLRCRERELCGITWGTCSLDVDQVCT